MIYREEFEKILKLIDAGIIGSQDSYIESILTTESIINSENFNLVLSPNGFIYTKDTSNLEKDFLEMDNFIQFLKEKESLRIGKNQFNFDWNLEILDFELYIENILFGYIECKTLINLETPIIISSNNSKDEKDGNVEITEFLNNFFNELFTKLVEKIKNPSLQLFPELNYYFSRYNNQINEAQTEVPLNENYENLIQHLKVSINYRVNVEIDKNLILPGGSYELT